MGHYTLLGWVRRNEPQDVLRAYQAPKLVINTPRHWSHLLEVPCCRFFDERRRERGYSMVEAVRGAW